MIKKKTLTPILLAGIFFIMLGLSFAAVPLYDLFCRVTGFGGTTQNASKEFKTPQHEYDEGPKIFSCCQKRSKFLLCWNKDVALRRQFRPSWQLVFALLTAHLIKAKQSSKQSCQIKAYLFRLVWDPHSTVIQHDTAKAIFSCEL